MQHLVPYSATLFSAPTNFLFYVVFADAFVQIVRDEGVAALWNGTFPSLLLVLNPAIQFMIYEGLKRQLRRGIPREVSVNWREIREGLGVLEYLKKRKD